MKKEKTATKKKVPIGTIFGPMTAKTFFDQQEDGSYKMVRRLPNTPEEIKHHYPANGPIRLI